MSPSSARGVTANGNCTWRLYREMGQQLRSPQPAFALHLSVQTLIVLDGSGTSWSSDITAEAFGTRMRAFRSLETSGAGRARIVGEQSAQHQGLHRLVMRLKRPPFRSVATVAAPLMAKSPVSCDQRARFRVDRFQEIVP